MSSYLFDRYAGLTIGETQNTGRLFASKQLDDSGQVTGAGFRVNFNVSKSIKKEANTARITIYNLNSESIGLIERRDQIAILEAGYNGIPKVITLPNGNTREILIPNKEIIASGDIRNIVTSNRGADKITTFEIGDGEKSLNGSVANRSFPPNTGSKEIVDYLVGELDLVKGLFTEIKDSIFRDGFSAVGKVGDKLSEVLGKNDMEFSVQDGEIQIIEKNGFTSEEAVFLTSNTGLINSPSRKLIKTQDSKGKPSEVEGVEFTCLLNPKIRPGRRVKLESKSIQGVFTVRKLDHNGDTHEGQFITKVEAV